MRARKGDSAREGVERFAWQRLQASRLGAPPPGEPPRLRVGALEPAGPYRRARVWIGAPVSSYAARYDARTGERLGWLFVGLMSGLERALPDAACLDAAAEAARPPPDATLDRAGYEDRGGEPVFIARWRHEHVGVPVERDYIQAQVNGRTGIVFALHRRWHTIRDQPG